MPKSMYSLNIGSHLYSLCKSNVFTVISQLVSQKSMKYLVHNCVQSLIHATITILAIK